jgi:CheY-like chemotaxis protein
MSCPSRLLVVEDHDDTRALMVEFLAEQGYQVSEAETGVRATEMFRENPFDLVITDILLPDKDGLEVILEIRKKFPDAKFLAISGGGETLLADDCLHSARAFGAQKTLSKPFGPRDLLQTVEEILAH